MEFLENDLSYDEYCALRESVGWNNSFPEQTRSALKNSLYIAIAVENGQKIGMGRLIGDGVYYLIVDVIVRPECQGRGVGNAIADKLLSYVEDCTPPGGRSSVQLIAEQGKEGFYLKKGFKLIPHEYCGSGMRKIIRK